MDYKLADIFDLPKLKELMEGFYGVTGISSSMIDVEGNHILRAGWQEICKNFHQQMLLSAELCHQSNRRITDCSREDVHLNKPYFIQKCSHGLFTAAAPIEVKGIHLATLMFGQLFLEPPDVQVYRQYARQYDYPEDEYLAALAKVPVRHLENLDAIIQYFGQLAKMLGEMGLNRLELLEARHKELQREKFRLKRIFDKMSNVAVQVYDFQGKILYWNAASEEFFGWKDVEVTGKTLDQVFDPETQQDFLHILHTLDQGLMVSPREWSLKNKKGNEIYIYSTVIPISEEGKEEFVCMDIDITEQKVFEKEIARLDRLNLVGEMAASIGHEVRNPMTTVRGFLQVLSTKEDCRPYYRYYQMMIEELDRANTIITEFLSLAKNKPIQLERSNLNRILYSLGPLIEANAQLSNTTVRIDVGEIPEIILDEKEIRQLILNLVRNAMEAMEENGHLWLKTSMENGQVALRVQDNGSGIDSSVLEQLGKPFLSTKPNGTGLGLAVCYSIALRHQAKIEVETGDHGTTFMVLFPVANG